MVTATKLSKHFPVMRGRKDAGYQLDKLQRGKDPDDWKPMSTIGAGVREIRIREAGGAFRIIYVAHFAGRIHVLHLCCTLCRSHSCAACFSEEDAKNSPARYRACADSIQNY